MLRRPLRPQPNSSVSPAEDAVPADAAPEAIEPAAAAGDTGNPAMPQLNSLGHTMLSVVINPYFDWQNDHGPGHPYHQTIIYEAHVKGMTATHPDIPEELRGTYARDCAIRRSSIT